MARRGRPRGKEPLPPPLPPETRTVGQLVAESIRLYGRHFWPTLALGIGPAGLAIGGSFLDRVQQVVLTTAGGAVVLGACFTAACAIAADIRPDRRTFLRAWLTAIVVFLTQSVLFFLLRSGSEQATRVALFLANLVISPLLFVGAALLYEDQAARVKSGSRTRRNNDGDLHSSLKPDTAGRSDAEVES